MNYFLKYFNNSFLKTKGFVLPFTLLICAIMLLISVSISTILTKQIYFSNLARDSQVAYYAADNAAACALAVDETYVDANGIGIFPYDAALTTAQAKSYMSSVPVDINARRGSFTPPMASLAATLEDIQCAQSYMFLDSDFIISSVNFQRNVPAHDAVPASTEFGKSSSLMMKMVLGDGSFRCAKVTVHKTQSYRQIVAQGFSRCDRPDGSVERAVISTTLTQ